MGDTREELQITKTSIIEKLARDGIVEEMIEKMATREQRANLDDLANDTYLTLLEKDDELIVDLYIKKELRWYIQRILVNSVYSKTSPYYKKYKKFSSITKELLE